MNTLTTVWLQTDILQSVSEYILQCIDKKMSISFATEIVSYSSR